MTKFDTLYKQIISENTTAAEPKYFGPAEKKQEWLNWLKSTKHVINLDGSVSIRGNVNLSGTIKNLGRIPFNFDTVHGSFDCSKNMLSTLEGSPKRVEANFDCSGIRGITDRDNKGFQTLEGSPETVGGDFICVDRKLKSLSGAPKTIGGSFKSNSFSNDDYLNSKRTARNKSSDFSVDVF